MQVHKHYICLLTWHSVVAMSYKVRDWQCRPMHVNLVYWKYKFGDVQYIVYSAKSWGVRGHRTDDCLVTGCDVLVLSTYIGLYLIPYQYQNIKIEVINNPHYKIIRGCWACHISLRYFRESTCIVLCKLEIQYAYECLLYFIHVLPKEKRTALFKIKYIMFVPIIFFLRFITPVSAPFFSFYFSVYFNSSCLFLLTLFS